MDKEIPIKLKSTVNRARELLLSKYRDSKAVCIIGSVADGTFNKSSDIDFVWIKNHPIDWKRWFKLEEELNSKNKSPKIQLVPFTPQQVLEHFNNSSTMAHSIQKGIFICGREDKFISKLLKRKLSLPTKEWMRHWFEHWLKIYRWAKDSIKREKRFHKRFCKTKCYCSVLNDIARVTVNFAILCLETNQIVPTSKAQIIKSIRNYSLPEDVFRGLKLALKFSSKDRFLTLEKADEILFSATWFKRRLSKKLEAQSEDKLKNTKL